MLMRVYMSKKLNRWSFQPEAVCVETNLAWAVPYWTERKKKNPKIFWTIG